MVVGGFVCVGLKVWFDSGVLRWRILCGCCVGGYCRVVGCGFAGWRELRAGLDADSGCRFFRARIKSSEITGGLVDTVGFHPLTRRETMLITVSGKKWKCRLVRSNSIKMRRLIGHHGTRITCDMDLYGSRAGHLDIVERLLECFEMTF